MVPIVTLSSDRPKFWTMSIHLSMLGSERLALALNGPKPRGVQKVTAATGTRQLGKHDWYEQHYITLPSLSVAG